jgi:putative ABC transport system permease protein
LFKYYFFAAILIFPGLLKNQISDAMIKNFFLIATRNISRHKVFTFINVTGLAIGLAASLLILLWIEDELSFENFNDKAGNIFRVEEDQFYEGQRYHVNVTPYPSGPVWKEKIPEIIDQTRISRLSRLLFRKDDKVFFESSVIAADSGMLNIFTFPLLLGDRETAMRAPHSIILTEKLAEKYFGYGNPLGKTITIENSFEFMVTGVMQDLPKNSMFTFEAVIPFNFLRETGLYSESWGNNSIATYLLLEKEVNIEEVNKKLTNVVLEHSPQTTTKFTVFPLLSIHIHSQFGYGENKGPVIAIYIFSLIAVFVLLIACINFVNLSTARASSRFREIGIKKVSGADRKSLIMQFLSESLLMVALAMIIAIVLVGVSLEMFNNVSGKKFELSDLLRVRFILSLIVVGGIAGFLSGIYPAFYLSAIRPIAVLKGTMSTGRSNGRLRQILVVVQFSLSILIAVLATFMFLQLSFLQDKDLGFDKENLLCIPMADGMKSKYYSLKNELQKETLILGVTASRSNPVMIGSNSGGADWDGRDPEKRVLIGTNGVDYDYVATLRMKLVSGRDFSRDFPGDLARDTTGNFLINEEVARLMGEGDPVGKRFSFMGGLNGKIIGVLKNFNFKGADQPIEPIAFALGDTRFLNYILIRLEPVNIQMALKKVDQIWNQQIPEYPLNYTFIGQDYDNLFRTQIRLTGLLKYFTILACIIACLGLYGLSSFSTEKRTNEIGIRKVMGAGSMRVIYTMAKEFLILVLISIGVAMPVGWIIVEKLLKQFAVRIEINLVVFVIIAIGAIVIALMTVGYQAFKASGINPAEALKTE